MKKQTRLYNVIILPIWLLLLFPQVLVIVIPGNLLVDCLVLLLTLCALKHLGKKDVMKKLWWKFWLLGFAADAVGLVWMALGLWTWLRAIIPLEIRTDSALYSFGVFWENTVGNISHNPFAHPAALVWTLLGITLAGVCIYFFDKRAMRSCEELTPREKRTIALTMAVVTAPWLFLIPVY